MVPCRCASRSRVLAWTATGALLAATAACSLTSLDGFTASARADAGPIDSGRATDAAAPTDDGGDTAAVSHCGNGIIEPPEQCDPGMTTSEACVDCKVVCSGPDEHEDPTTHHCYAYYGDAASERWDVARTTCTTWGGALVAVGSANEYTFILGFAGKDTWLGATDIAKEGDFMWSQPEPFTFTDWEPGYPSDTDHTHNCVAIAASLEWQDRPCSSTNQVLCERLPLGTRP